MTNPAPQPQMPESVPVPAQRKGYYSTGWNEADEQVPDPVAQVAAVQPQDPELPWFRINWEIKALVPIACVLLGGMLLFLLATISWRDPERHLVLLVAGAGAVAICGALLVVLTYMVQRPMVELQQKIAQLGSGDLSVSVSFAESKLKLIRSPNACIRYSENVLSELKLHGTMFSKQFNGPRVSEFIWGQDSFLRLC